MTRIKLITGDHASDTEAAVCQWIADHEMNFSGIISIDVKPTNESALRNPGYLATIVYDI